ncbi:hypothetical protein LJK87_49630 [Paenibacillus sp. P25]|nr:hypothetical protein LJK87_49630 [Paenibacillus sp. P25]
MPDAGLGWWLAGLPPLYAAGRLYQLMVRPRNKLTLHAGLLLIAALQAWLLFGSGYAYYWIVPFGWLLAYRGAHMASPPWHEMFPGSFSLMGLVIYFAASVVMRFVPSFAPYQPVLSWSGATALAAALLLVNESNLKEESLSGKKHRPWPNRFYGRTGRWSCSCWPSFWSSPFSNRCGKRQAGSRSSRWLC